MRKGILVLTLILVPIICFSMSAWADEKSPEVQFSSESVLADTNAEEFTLDILIKNADPFSSAEFGLKLEGNVKIKQVDYSDEIEGTEDISKVDVKEKNGIYYFGFAQSENKYSGNLKICTVHFAYSGSAPGAVTMELANIITVTGSGGAVKNSLTPHLKVEVNRESGDSGSDGHSGGGGSNQPTTSNLQAKDGVITAVPQVSNGKATIKLDNTSISQAFEQVKENENGMKTIVVEVSPAAGANKYSIEIPAQVFDPGEKNKLIQINTPAAEVTLPMNMITQEQLGNAQNVALNVSSVDPSTLPDHLKDKIGNHPVIEINLELDGKLIEWENKASSVGISIPYVPTEAERKNPDNIIVWYIDGKGIPQVVKNGKYDPKSGMVTFSVTHFSQYGIVYAEKTFDDIRDSWAKKEIEALAVREIINGTSEKTYSPQVNITRADFMKLLVGVIDQTAEPEKGFSDVTPQDYFYEAVNTAKALGLANGTGDNKLNPKSQITRQDMMVLIDRALSILGKKLTDKANLNVFTDADNIAGYAKDSVAKLVASGIIQGSNGNLRPQDNLTRAEAARVLFLVYQR
ncbi:MAG: S-layer homology domain-containing protein [Dehalobacterium sp.]